MKSKTLSITLSKQLNEEFTSYLDCCYSLGVTPNVCAFLNFYSYYSQ